MTLRGIVWLLVLFAVAALFATFGHFNTGQVLVVYPPYRVDLSLNLCVLALIVLFIALYALMRIVRNIWLMPSRVNAYRARARNEKGQRALREALAHLYAGRFARAEKAAAESLNVEANRAAASLLAAAAAHRMQEYARRDDWLSKVEGPEWQEARLLAAADMRAEARDAEGALEALAEMRVAGGKRIQAQQVALRAQQQLRNWGEVLKLSKALEKRDALHPTVSERLRRQAAEHLLRERRHDADALLDTWQSLSNAERQMPRLADLAAGLLVALGRKNEARRIVENALAKHWDAGLLRRYPETADADVLPLIQNAETWQRQHPDDAELQFALGRLCLQQQLWGKAQAFLDAALKLAPTPAFKADAHRALAQLFEQLGEPGRAAEHYRAGALATAQ